MADRKRGINRSDWTGTINYDGNENLIGRAGWTFTYDAQNRLTSIDSGSTHIHQHYDPLNRIVAWDANGVITTQMWDDWNLIEEHTANDSFQRMYFHGAAVNEIVGSYGPAYGDLFYFQDGRGNVTHLTGPGNNVIEHYTYFVSGQPNYLSGSAMNNRFLFQGAIYLPAVQIYDMRNRFYHPNLGRFMQMDPVGFDAGDMNLFRYCGNDPVDMSDPTGLVTTFPGSTIEQRLHLFYGDNTGLDSLSELDHRNVGLTMAQLKNDGAAITPIPNPRTKASAEAVWDGETPIDSSMSREQIIKRYGGSGAATTPVYSEPTVTTVNGKPKVTIKIMATRHMPNNVSTADYDRMYAIETKSVRCIQNSVPGVSARLSNLVSNIGDANSAADAVRQSVKGYMRQEYWECKVRADVMGGNANP